MTSSVSTSLLPASSSSSSSPLCCQVSLGGRDGRGEEVLEEERELNAFPCCSSASTYCIASFPSSLPGIQEAFSPSFPPSPFLPPSSKSIRRLRRAPWPSPDSSSSLIPCRFPSSSRCELLPFSTALAMARSASSAASLLRTSAILLCSSSLSSNTRALTAPLTRSSQEVTTLPGEAGTSELSIDLIRSDSSRLIARSSSSCCSNLKTFS
mmetsp:Transcript_23252/g.52209  ORF Transcript_23252/g.52209 Transcript_23252/m.52209 type:complete len:210 (-) Transcript_23252:2092-2721(-)